MTIKKIVLLSCACAFISTQGFAEAPMDTYVKITNKTGAPLTYTASTNGCTHGLTGAMMAKQNGSLAANFSKKYAYPANTKTLCFAFYGNQAAGVTSTYPTYTFTIHSQQGKSTYSSKERLPNMSAHGNTVSFNPKNNTLELTVEK